MVYGQKLGFSFLLQFSKCDFWNLGEIWDRNRYSKKKMIDFFRRKKSEHFLVENFLGPKIFDFFVEKKIPFRGHRTRKRAWAIPVSRSVSFIFFEKTPAIELQAPLIADKFLELIRSDTASA